MKTRGSGSKSSRRKSASSPSTRAPLVASGPVGSTACPDYEEFLAALGAHRVRYLVGGAHAVALQARPRATKGLDVFIDRTAANARRAEAAIAAFFGGRVPAYADAAALLEPGVIIQLGVAPVRIDILADLGAVRFRDAWRRRVDARYGRVPAHYLSLDDLIAEKEHWARPQDEVDLRALRAARRRLAARERGVGPEER